MFLKCKQRTKKLIFLKLSHFFLRAIVQKSQNTLFWVFSDVSFSFFWIIIIKDVLIDTQDIIGNNSTESFYWWKAFYQIHFAESDICICALSSG